MSEAFVYMWYDSKNSMYYIGYHKGTPDDGYTHTSSIMESFKIAPKGFRRRILAYGTRDEMMQLEVALLKNRKERCWDKYYNVIIQFPPLPKFGKDNPHWKHGLSYTTEYQAMQCKKYYENNREKVLKKNKNYYEKNREKNIEYARKYREENREKLLEKQKKYHEKNREEKKKQQKECTFIPVDQY